jgi:hypothetical protein
MATIPKTKPIYTVQIWTVQIWLLVLGTSLLL